MAEADVTREDVEEAVSFLQAALTEEIPDGDFSEGSPYFDHLVRGMAFIYAIMRRQIGIVRARQSVLTLGELPEDESVDDAADAVLANVFRTRSLGRRTRGPAVAHFSQRTDARVRVTDRFRKTRDLIFFVDANDDYFIDGRTMRPVIDATGRVVEYTVTIPLIAARSGTEYNVAPGAFASVDRFTPFLLSVENTVQYQDGENRQSTNEFIRASETALSLRALINARSNAAILQERFSDIVSQVVTVEHGDEEMARDLVVELANRIQLHTGGHMDVYIRAGLQQAVDRFPVGIGIPYVRPDNRVLTFRHIAGVDFTTGFGIIEQVVVGDVLNIGGGLPEAPFQFVVVAVRPLELDVSPRTPFTTASDELLPVPTLSYSIGNNFPSYDNKMIATVGGATTTRQLTDTNRVMLTGQPGGQIRKVEITDAPALYDPLKDPSTGTLIFGNRVNAPITATPTRASDLQYRVIVRNPEEAQSGSAVQQVEVGWPGAVFDNLTMEVTYDTAADFSLVDAFVRDLENRPGAASTLLRSFHPVYVAATIPFSFNDSPDPLIAAAITGFDEQVAARAVEAFITAYRGRGPLTQLLVASVAGQQSALIAAIFPFTLTYELFAPDGRVYRFSSQDKVTVFPNGTSSTAALLNPLDFGLPLTGYFAALKKQLLRLGVSDRVIRLAAATGAISYERRM